MQDWKAKQAAKAAAASALQAANPHLVPVSEKNNSLIAAAKNARIELARAFPGIKFSVKTKRFSGGDSMDVRWTDGPTSGQVDAIVDKYSAGYFDGSDDSYNYTAGAWTDAFGDAKYVHATRDDSDKALASAIRTVKQEYAGNLAARNIDEISIADLRSGKLMNVDIMDNGSHYWTLHSIIYRVAGRRTWAIDKTPKAAEMVEAYEVAA